MPEIVTIEVETLPPARRHEEILRAFDALAEGSVLHLKSPHRPGSLLFQFLRDRPSQFDWNVLEDGPEQFRTEIRRRSKEGSRTVFEFLETDHRRLDAILMESQRLATAGSIADARMRFSEFVCGLDRHIHEEEAVLFPAFEDGIGSGGPTDVMCFEHAEIHRLMDVAVLALSKDDATGFITASTNLGRGLGAHNMKEERVLYPMSDEFAGDDETRDELIRQMQVL